MPQVCVDANLILASLVPDPFSQKAARLLAQWQRQGQTLIVPTLLAFEVTANLRRFVYTQALTMKEGDEALRYFLRLPIRLSAQRGIFPLAFKLAQEFNRPRAYDSTYLALAQLRRCDFWTADERLYNSVSAKLSWVHFAGN
ncbi:MAG: type II toxin-antitoxin system VapC family toxin [Anaerolineae bacterium]|nr:type II toxin-antitoxin system VapC family toxin [Anaerolineae bacterium]